jgi:hypothetical protein
MSDILQWLLVDFLWGLVVVKIVFYGIITKKAAEWILKLVKSTDKGKMHLDRLKVSIAHYVEQARKPGSHGNDLEHCLDARCVTL